MVLSTETFNQSVRAEYSEAVNARYTFQPLWVSVWNNSMFCNELINYAVRILDENR